MKCANILLTNNGGLKIADFGLTNLQNLLKAGRGIPAWSAPEFIDTKRQGEYGLTKADIWSLGCTVLEMLTEKLPYSGLETWSIWYRIGQGIPPSISDSLSDNSRNFIQKCLQVNLKERPTASQLLEHPFVKVTATCSSTCQANYYCH
ncbi:hypothetical protein JCGZ_24885 [Jatropha curcas]|uniref:Protein kinase domain-containing protein n=1 Tax=Jatropha curcas TaxID=180498 RepID=A0A067KXF5_JATCU|nr:mitogen-activated protein kinase kinase kinase 1-like [Jatropha curcas]KDP40886.1 hypothetical protein JCGZ_24885 [Jatropha curcas]